MGDMDKPDKGLGIGARFLLHKMVEYIKKDELCITEKIIAKANKIIAKVPRRIDIIIPIDGYTAKVRGDINKDKGYFGGILVDAVEVNEKVDDRLKPILLTFEDISGKSVILEIPKEQLEEKLNNAGATILNHICYANTEIWIAEDLLYVTRICAQVYNNQVRLIIDDELKQLKDNRLEDILEYEIKLPAIPVKPAKTIHEIYSEKHKSQQTTETKQ